MAMFQFDTNSNPPKCICNIEQFALAKPTASLFDGSAKTLAEEISKGEMLVQHEEWSDREKRKVRSWKVKSDKDTNKPAQIRKFYDEVCMWADKTRSIDALEKNLPFIKMMNAKVAYARGRELVDDKFLAWFSLCLSQIKSADEEGLSALQNFRTLFEAFLGFYKVVRPK